MWASKVAANAGGWRAAATTRDEYRREASARRTGLRASAGSFARRETEALIDAGESLIARLIRDRSAPRQRYGSYTFDGDVENGVMIKWEGDSDVVHGIEPFAHLSIELANAAADARFIEPMQDILDCAKPMLFTEKLNLKRAHDGGINPLHQDFPYWLNVAENAAEVATAMLFLDDADQDNGCLYVVPGSHAAANGCYPRVTTDSRDTSFPSTISAISSSCRSRSARGR